MLAEISWQQLVEWRAALDVIGLDDRWHQAGTVAAEITRLQQTVIAALGGKPPKSQPKAKDYIPLIRPHQDKPTGMMNPAQGFNALASMIMGR